MASQIQSKTQTSGRFIRPLSVAFGPNGEILEGNPVQVDEWIPLTPENVESYYVTLLDRALAHAREASR